jgi:hypothetical protein
MAGTATRKWFDAPIRCRDPGQAAIPRTGPPGLQSTIPGICRHSRAAASPPASLPSLTVPTGVRLGRAPRRARHIDPLGARPLPERYSGDQGAGGQTLATLHPLAAGSARRKSSFAPQAAAWNPPKRPCDGLVGPCRYKTQHQRTSGRTISRETLQHFSLLSGLDSMISTVSPTWYSLRSSCAL